MKPRQLTALLLAALLALGVSACGDEADEPAGAATSESSSSDAAPVPPAEALALIADGAETIDVRTPEEFDGAHLEGAVNIDVQEADFEERVAELPREASYVVYCATGRRATGAVETMRELGFTDVVNGGGYDDLAEE